MDRSCGPDSDNFGPVRTLPADVAWQSHTHEAGYGGGTIARYFNQMNMEVTDWGVGILSMHSTYDIASKADLRALQEGFVAFLKS